MVLGPIVFIGSFLFFVLIALILIASGLYVVKQQTVAIIERFGKYQKHLLQVLTLKYHLELMSSQPAFNCGCCKVKLW